MFDRNSILLWLSRGRVIDAENRLPHFRITPEGAFGRSTPVAKAGSAGIGGRHLKPLIAMPWMKCRCAKKKAVMIGATEISDAAIINVHCPPYCV